MLAGTASHGIHGEIEKRRIPFLACGFIFSFQFFELFLILRNARGQGPLTRKELAENVVDCNKRFGNRLDTRSSLLMADFFGMKVGFL